ncbi:hypothetical protein P154DRAFT_525284 [Amniculicola lignicola CBS 123094]|uniref:Uncharacterized protein n=1 Tax=Amniculicola lignicola CBS 123094 TaxID=1392246 RepID=A0A6A5W6A0_9PLEO|nr:hypothetical protein P154DRAFT_525284 [Amniculicola lignicola CBS 123094]
MGSPRTTTARPRPLPRGKQFTGARRRAGWRRFELFSFASLLLTVAPAIPSC